MFKVNNKGTFSGTGVFIVSLTHSLPNSLKEFLDKKHYCIGGMEERNRFELRAPIVLANVSCINNCKK